MCNVNPMFHMDRDYMWRWFVTDALGNLLSVSTKAFFHCEDARRDFDIVLCQFKPS